jgi:hypothetical protein
MKTRLLYFAGAFVAGSLSFWTPIVLVHMLFGEDWGFFLSLLPLTLLLPVFACVVLEAFAERWNRTRPVFAAAMVLGIWATTAFWSTLANSFSPGQGFHAADAWNYVGLTTAFFPASTIMITAYNGSLFAVLLTTMALAIFSGTHWSFQPILRRCTVFGQR